jgi:hypothetical protein
MLRYLPAGIEVLGLLAIVAGAFLFNPALGLVAVGCAVLAVGYSLEESK